jgi:hypothetical protein
VWILSVCCISGSAHSGRTDARGGHRNHSTGEYHYHHGFPAHDHYDINGDGTKDCPYNFEDRTNRSGSSGSNHAVKETEVKTVNRSEVILEYIGDIIPLVLIGIAFLIWAASWILAFISEDIASFALSISFKLIGLAILMLFIGLGYKLLQTIWNYITLLFQ